MARKTLSSYGSSSTNRRSTSRSSSPRAGQKVTLKAKPGQKKISFTKGGLHASTNTPQGQKIPSSKLAAAKAGRYGAKAQKQEMFRENVLTGRK